MDVHVLRTGYLWIRVSPDDGENTQTGFHFSFIFLPEGVFLGFFLVGDFMDISPLSRSAWTEAMPFKLDFKTFNSFRCFFTSHLWTNGFPAASKFFNLAIFLDRHGTFRVVGDFGVVDSMNANQCLFPLEELQVRHAGTMFHWSSQNPDGMPPFSITGLKWSIVPASSPQ